jgi:hypothetical protein
MIRSSSASCAETASRVATSRGCSPRGREAVFVVSIAERIDDEPEEPRAHDRAESEL